MSPVNEGELTLTAYRVSSAPPMRLVPAAALRGWMDATDQRFAYRCLPLLIANQAGWFLLSSHTIRVTWDGGTDEQALRLECLTGVLPHPATSHFGHGILTWRIPYLFRTPPGYNLLVRGPANWPKAGAFALEGIVESDWSVATFTMNWKLMVVDRPVTFEAGEPICMLVPQRRGELEAFRPEIRDMAADPRLSAAYQRWAGDRARFLVDLRETDSEAARQLWQKHYFRGTAPDGSAATVHQTRLQLREFDDPNDERPRGGGLMTVATVTLQDVVSIPAEVAHHIVGGGALLLNPETGHYYGLDEVGSRVWELLSERGSLAEAFRALADEYEVDPKELERDLLRLVGELMDKGLVALHREPDTAQPSAGG